MGLPVVCHCSSRFGSALRSGLEGLPVGVGHIRTWSCLAHMTVERGGDASLGILRDMTITTKLCSRHVELLVVLRELALEGLEEVEEMLGLNAACA